MENQLTGISATELTRLAGEYLQQRGMRVETARTAASGAEFVARKGGESWLVRCMHWNGRDVDAEDVRALSGLVASGAADGGCIFTNGRFTWDAMVLGEELGIELVDGNELSRVAANESGSGQESSQELYLGTRKRPRTGLIVLLVTPVLALAIVVGLVYFDFLELKGIGGAPKPVVSNIGATPRSAEPAADPAADRDLLAEFDAQYEPPEECKNWRTEEQMVDCANRRIRAYKEYERSHGQQ